MTIGVMGGGQLARMLAMEGMRLGLDFLFLEPNPEAVSGLGETLRADYADPQALEQLARRCDAVTYEFENVPVEALAGLPRLWPPPRALEVSQDRLREKQLFEKLGVPCARFWSVDDPATLPYPVILKTRRLGYDGKGQCRVENVTEARNFLSTTSGPWIAEEIVTFERELSTLAVRSRSGETRFYPLSENRHQDGILRETRAPARSAPEQVAQALTEKLLDELGYCGVLAVEWFCVQNLLWANEIAPRVHNSGHWTLDGATTSQFENHLRAGLGLPLGDCGALGPCRMENLLGDPSQGLAYLKDPQARLHLYGKSARPNRKVGHVTWVQPWVGSP